MAVKFVATTKTVTSTLTGLLSTITTSSDPSFSVTCIVESDPSVDSNETMAVDNEMNLLVTQLGTLIWLYMYVTNFDCKH